MQRKKTWQELLIRAEWALGNKEARFIVKTHKTPAASKKTAQHKPSWTKDMIYSTWALAALKRDHCSIYYMVIKNHQQTITQLIKSLEKGIVSKGAAMKGK